MSTMNISLPDELKTWIEDEVKRSGFANASEFFHHLVRDAKARKEDGKQAKADATELEALLIEGLESGEGEPVTAEWWAKLRSEANEELEKRGAAPIDWERSG